MTSSYLLEKERIQSSRSVQVKSTSELTWTAKRLARRSPKGELPKSIVGKAYYNVAQFGPGIRRASILSNRPLSATLVTATKSDLHDGELSVADLCSADQETLMKSLEADTRRIIAPGHVAPKTNVVEGRKPPGADAAKRAQHPAGADTQLGVALPATDRRGGRNGRSLRHRCVTAVSSLTSRATFLSAIASSRRAYPHFQITKRHTTGHSSPSCPSQSCQPAPTDGMLQNGRRPVRNSHFAGVPSCP
jgi:hypothetical protein